MQTTTMPKKRHAGFILTITPAKVRIPLAGMGRKTTFADKRRKSRNAQRRGWQADL